MQDEQKLMLKGAGSALVYLVGFLLMAFAIGFALSELRIHNIEVIGFSLVLLMCVAGGWLWGRSLAQITGAPDTRRVVIANTVSYGPSVLGAMLGLTALEPLAFGPSTDMPVHILFEIIFTTAVFLITAVSGLANGIALKDSRLTARLAAVMGISGAVTFLAVTLLLDLAGRRVGGPDAARTFNMLGNLAIGALFSAGVCGAILAREVSRFTQQRTALADMTPAPVAD